MYCPMRAMQAHNEWFLSLSEEEKEEIRAKERAKAQQSEEDGKFERGTR